MRRILRTGRGKLDLVQGPCADRALALRCWETVKEGLAQAGRGTHGLVVHPWIELLWGHFKVENRSLRSEAATLEELEWGIERQIIYYNRERRHLGLDY